jgi:penicillin-binding protein 1C
MVFVLLVLVVVGWLALHLVPIPPALLIAPVQSIELLDRHGQPLRELRVDERFSRPLRYDEIPRNVVRAMLAAEDKRFFSHSGIDLLATARAAWSNGRHGRVTSGASTITQQLVKQAEPRPRTLRTKLIEAVTALRLEQVWTKEKILAAYLNRIDFGNLNVGIASAATYYFGKPLSDLSDAEAALLAGLPKNPRRLNPHVASGAAKRRQQIVLRRMQEIGWLEDERAFDEPLRLRPPRRVFRAPHFVDLVLRSSGTGFPPVTTLDLGLNDFVESTVRDQLARLRPQDVRNAAVVVIDNASGDVLALVGSEDYFAPGTGQVNGAWARRSPGSTLKPFTYLLALERGATPATIVADVPAVFASATGAYRPENYNHRCYGPVSYRHALGNSLNIPAVRVLAAIGGAPVLAERLRAWGITTLDKCAPEYGLGLTIGNAEVRLIELTNAYAALARGGVYRPWRLVPGPVERFAQHSTLNTQPAAWLIADMLADNSARMLAFGANSALRFDFPVACKTGTSTDFRDNWAMGFTPEFTVGVWVGNFDGSPMREVSGVTGAAPILHTIFEHLRATRGTSWYERPASIVEREVHPITGKLRANDRGAGVLACSNASGSRETPRRQGCLHQYIREKFVRDQLPELESPDDYDANDKAKLGAEYLDWLASAENSVSPRAVADPDAREKLRLVAPQPGSTFLLDPDVPTSREVGLVASGSCGVVWESATLRCADGRAEIVEGEHRLTARDAKTGERVETWIRVKAL